VSPRLTGEGPARRRTGGESGRRLGEGSVGCRGDSSLRFGDRFRGGDAGFLRGDAEKDMHANNHILRGLQL
jgi:hypothetical protein